MRISELSAASGISIATLKYYLREGLMPPGAPTARNQASYSESHLRRLRLIRTLTEVGGLNLRAVKEVLDALDDEDVPPHELLGVAHRALGARRDVEDPPADVLEARADVDRYIANLGWRVGPRAPARRALADALVTLRRAGRDVDAVVFEPYARAADRLAAHEIRRVVPAASRAEAVESVVVGTVVFEAALVALRRLAQEHHSAERLGEATRPRVVTQSE